MTLWLVAIVKCLLIIRIPKIPVFPTYKIFFYLLGCICVNKQYKLNVNLFYFQTLAPKFLEDALINPEAEVYIVDEFGKRWPCFLRRGFGEPVAQGVICRGWARFCRHKGLNQGQKIMFGVTSPKANQMHYIPLP